MEVNTISELVKGTIEYGIFFGLFVSLLVYVIKNTDRRETEYRKVIDMLSSKILCTATSNNDKIIGITDDIDALDTKVQHISDKVDIINAKVDTIDKKVEMLPYKIHSEEK